ncbi:MAG TPA: TetR/AcrR family transcriptional regulator [Candidatus Acidoferrales bacterium]|nr:TetR/AcrR family transcriptional regulator [Candidatus Acidoferrales bacterium]
MSRARSFRADVPSRRPSAPARSKQQVRTAATRRRLLAASENIFARDGFEAARLEDIASLAGYTRGAFYANFESKEDIFFALLEHWVSRRLSEVESLLAQRESPAKRLRALREHYAHITQDRRLGLLSLEFKLFAIRHPEAHARLRARQRRIRRSGASLLQRLGKITGRTLPISSTAAATGLAALANALLLEHLVDQATLTEQDMSHLLGVFFDAVLGTKAAG